MRRTGTIHTFPDGVEGQVDSRYPNGDFQNLPPEVPTEKGTTLSNQQALGR